MGDRFRRIRIGFAVILSAGLLLTMVILFQRILLGETFFTSGRMARFYYNPAMYAMVLFLLLLLVMPHRWREHRHRLLTAAALFILVIAGFQHDYYPLKIDGDGIGYYSYLHSLYFDRDIDFRNQYRDMHAARYGLHGVVDSKGREHYVPERRTKRMGNAFAIGPALAWYPIFALADRIYRLRHPDRTGYESFYVNAIHGAHLIYGFLGLLFLHLALSRCFHPAAAFLATVSVPLLSPAYFYLRNAPFYSHILSFCSVSLFLYLFVRFRQREALWKWAFLGALGGLTALMRWQNLLFMAVPVLDRVIRRFQADRSSRKDWLADAGCFAAYGGCGLLLLLPQLIAFKFNYGTCLVVPQGSQFITFIPEWIIPTLFSSFHGFFYWHPFMITILLGFLPPWRRHTTTDAALLISVFGGFLLQVYLNSSISQYWAGASFGGRRFIDVLPFAAFGIALFLEKTGKSDLGRWLVRTVFLALFLGNVFLEKAFAWQKIDPQQPATFARMVRESLASFRYLWQYDPKYIYLAMVTALFVFLVGVFLDRMRADDSPRIS